MNIGGSEWIIIGLMALFLLFGSKKLPEFSRMIGRVVGEYEKARMIAQREMAQSIPSQAASYHGPNIQGPVNSEREKLEVVAMSLGIESRNKNDDELRELISDKIKNQWDPIPNTDNQYINSRFKYVSFRQTLNVKGFFW